jgi:acetyl esterase/lipase
VVVAVDYALSRPGSPSWPENFEDVREAVRWTRRHARDYGIDPGRIAALGASAGGHLAAMLGTDPPGPSEDAPTPGAGPGTPSSPSARVQAVIDFYGPSDLLALEASPTGPATAVRLLVGGGPEQVRGRYDAASPVRHVSPGDPPMLLVHGADDGHVPVEQSRMLAAALAKAGISHRLMVLENARHGFGFQLDRRDLLPEILAFLRSVWDSQDGSGRDTAHQGRPTVTARFSSGPDR